MEYIYTALLLHKARQEINERSVKKVLEAADIDIDIEKIKNLVVGLEGVDIDETIKIPVQVVAVPVKEVVEETVEEEISNDAAKGLDRLFG